MQLKYFLGLIAGLLICGSTAYALPVLTTAPMFAGVGQNIVCRVQNVSTSTRTVLVESIDDGGGVQTSQTFTLTPGVAANLPSAADGLTQSCRFTGASSKRIRASATLSNVPGGATTVIVEAH